MSQFSELAAQKDEEIRKLQESLDRLESMIDRGWMPLYGMYEDPEGPTLQQVKDTARRNRELMALNPHIGNGLELINSYVWGDGIHYDGIAGARQGRGVNVQAFIDDKVNQVNFFDELARKQRQAAFYCDGIVMYAGVTEDDGTKRIHPISIMNISDDYRNPEDPSEIWAYRRSWTKRTPGNAKDEPRVEWIFANRFLDKINGKKTIPYGGKNEPIALNKVMFVKKSIPVVGWAYGVADVQRGIAWAEDYRQAMLDGKSMNASMAAIMATAKNNTTAGASNAAVALGNMTASGGVAQVGQNNGWQVLPTAGQAYDFQKLLPLLANFAAGIGVSVVALSMNSGNAGGSYGAAKSLDRPEQLSTSTRRKYNAALDREVLLWAGADEKKLGVWFNPIIDLTEKYRGEQIAELRLGTGLYEGEEVKQMHAVLDGRDPKNVTPVPEGWLIPQNRESIELRTVDPNISGNPATGSGMAPTQGSGAKGMKTGSGDQKSDDIRTNREYLRGLMENDDIAGIMIDLINELRNNKSNS